jgi:DNA helicase-2/ATP-dependent DNA helicase PcrA
MGVRARRRVADDDAARLFSLDDDPPAAPAPEVPGAPPPHPPRLSSAPDPPAPSDPLAVPADESRLADPETLLHGLTEPQRRAVTHRGSPLLVVAGAGSGKTRVLTRRVAHLLATGDARPGEILAITFTNKAADEMRSRVAGLVGPAAERMWVSTFHSACLRILRSHAVRLGYRPGFTVYDDTDSRRLVELVMAELGIDARRLPPRAVAAIISQAKSDLVDFESFRADGLELADPYRRRVADVYADYQRRLLAANAMDFDDLLMVAVNLFQASDEVRQSYQHRFRHILVDEYQDTNRAQNELVILLGREHGNVTVVGDSDQSVYKWRGADIANILDFAEEFPNATTVLLEQNFRSTQTILDAANAVIAHNPHRHAKHLFTAGEAGEPIELYRAEDEHDEASWVGRQILGLRRRHGLAFGDVAVFYRTNAQSRVLEEELVRLGVPYRVVGGTRFYERREIRDLLAYLRVLANPDDAVSARRIVNVPKRGIGPTGVSRLAGYAGGHGLSFVDALGRPEEAGLTGKAVAAARQLHALIVELRGLLGAVPAGDLVQAVADRTGYLAELVAERSHEADGRIENIAELVGVAAEYDDVTELLETVALVADADELDGDGSRVSLMTLHTAKGLEFLAVFLTGLEDGVFPHVRAIGEPAELEEERRLCYVGITRARRHLALSHAWLRTLWGQRSPTIPSRFLTELPPELLHDVGPARPARLGPRPSSWARPSRPGGARPGAGLDADFDDGVATDTEGGRTFGRGHYVGPSGPRQSTGAEALGLAAGDRVLHDHWGEGVVVATKGTGDRAQATVRFEEVGEKNLLLSASPLRRA